MLDIIIVLIAMLGSIILAVVLLARTRQRVKPEDASAAPQIPVSASRRQRRILDTLEPPPAIPTLMDLVREEIQDLGINDIPGSEEISGPVLLKVYRRDAAVREQCPHGTYGFVVAEGVAKNEAGDNDVRLFCPECAGTDAEADTLSE
jgi:hypothetical protein